MKGTRHLPATLATTVAVVCAAGWYMNANAGDERDFDSCVRSDGSLTLTYTHGSGDEISVSMKPEGDRDATVSYRAVPPDGPTTAEGIIRTVHFDDVRGKVFYPDGRKLECSTRRPRQA